MTDTSKTQANKETGRNKFYFWPLVAACMGVVLFCGGSAWVISTYFY